MYVMFFFVILKKYFQLSSNIFAYLEEANSYTKKI